MGPWLPEPLLTAPDVEMVQTDAFIDTTGTFHGREGIDAFFQELYDGFDEMRFDPQTAFWTRDWLLLLVHAKAMSSGLPMDRTVAHLWEFDGGFVTRHETFMEVADALEAVGLSE